MRLRCERDVLRDALVTTGRAAGSGSGVLQALSGIHLALTGDRLTLTGTDGELAIQVRISVAGRQDGVAVVPAHLVGEIVRSLEPGAVEIEVDGDGAHISGGRSQFTLRTFSDMEFPSVTAQEGEGVTLGAAELAEGLRQVVRAAARDDSRPMFNGVLFSPEGEGLRLLATDGYRLAQRDLVGTTPLPEGRRMLVPVRTLVELQRLLGASGQGAGEEGQVVLRPGEVDATFEVGTGVVTTRLVGAEFPDTSQLFPASYPNRLVVGREAFLDALRRVRLLVANERSPVRMALGGDGIQLTANDEERGQASEDVDAKYEGTELTVAFNPAYLIEGVDAVIGDEVLMEVVDATKPATLRGSSTDPYRYLIMPVRVP